MSLFSHLNTKLLRWLDNINKPISLDKTSSIRRIARDAYEYSEADHSMWVSVEMQSVSPGYILYFSSLNYWRPPFKNEALTDADKQRILGKVCCYLDSRRTSYKVVP